MGKIIIGYTTGVFDLFHIGHLNILRNANSLCDRLIVGVSTDELAFEYKGKYPVIPFHERCEIVSNIRYVDAVVPQETLDKFHAWQKLQFDIIFHGDDWYGKQMWKKFDRQLKRVGVRVVYFPYTKGISSESIRQSLPESSATFKDKSGAGAIVT